MNKDRYDKITARATEDERERMEVLYDAGVALLEAYKSDRSAANLKNWQAAEEALNRLGAELEERYFSTGPVFENLLAVEKYLQGEGYKIKKTKIYDDAKKGKITVQPDKSVRRDDVIAYASKEGLRRIADESGNIDDKHAERITLENQRLKKQIEKLEWENARDQGKYLLKTDVVVQISMMFGALEAVIKHMLRTKIVDWLSMCSGNTAKANMVLDLAYQEVDGILDELGRMEEIGVEVKKTEG